MKRYLVIFSICLFCGFSQNAFSVDPPPCGSANCDPWFNNIFQIALANCPGCLVNIDYKYSPSCNEYYIGTITYLNSSCRGCSMNKIYQESVELLLKAGPLNSGITKVNDIPCWKLDTVATNGWSLQPCNVNACCKITYYVDKSTNPITITRIGVPIRVGDPCPEECTEICNYDYHPKIALQPDESIPIGKQRVSMRLIPVENNFYKIEITGNVEGNVNIRFSDYMGKTFKSFSTQIGPNNANPLIVDLSNLNGFVFYSINLDGDIVGKGKIVITK